MLKHKNEEHRGFTLVELVVVIAILGILAATAVPMVNNFLESSKAKPYKDDVATVQTAINAYHSSPGTTPLRGQRKSPLNAAEPTGELHPWSDID